MVVSAVKDAVDVPDVNKWRAYAVHGGTGVLVLCLIRDVYKKNVSQALAHTYCLGVNWILHNSIYVKELSELVPALGATAQQYSEENDRLRDSIGRLETNIRDFREAATVDIDARAEQLRLLNTQLEEQRRQLELGEARLQGIEELRVRLGADVNLFHDDLHKSRDAKAHAAALYALLTKDETHRGLASKALEVVTALQ